MHALIAALVTIDPKNITGVYLATGAVDVGIVAVVVEGLISLLKPWFDSAFPPSSQKHDNAIELALLVLTVGGVLLFQAVGPIGLHTGADAVALVVQTVLALFTEWGIYLKTRGPVPVTPTDKYMQKAQAMHPQLFAAPPALVEPAGASIRRHKTPPAQ